METDLIKQYVQELGSTQSPGSTVTQGHTYNPIPFPGYDKLPCHRRDASIKRWEKIDAIVGNWKDKLVLDYGCSTGYFTFQAAKAGASVLSIERDLQAAKVFIAVLAKFDKEYKLKVTLKKYWDASCKNSDWHIVFAMNILNWIGKEKAEMFLADLGNVGVMFLEMPLKGDGMCGSDWLSTDTDTIEWVKQKSKFDSVQPIGSSAGPGGKERTLFLCHSLKETPVKSI